MNNIINYLLHSGLCLLIFYAFYYIVLKKETSFQFNRFFLIGASLLAFTLPFLNFYVLFKIGYIEDVPYMPSIYLPEIVISDSIKNETSNTALLFNWKDLMVLFYCIGLVFFAMRLIIQLTTISNFINRYRHLGKYKNGCIIIETDGKLPTFSFKNYIFLDNSIPFTPEEKTQIFRHELVHVHQKHSLDILYFELLSIIFWFNPLLRWYKSAIRDTHEFIADKAVAQKTTPDSYASLVVRQLFQTMDLSIGSYFNKSQIHKRLNMITRIDRNTSFLRLALSIPLLIAAVLIMGFNLPQNYRDIDTFDSPEQTYLFNQPTIENNNVNEPDNNYRQDMHADNDLPNHDEVNDFTDASVSSQPVEVLKNRGLSDTNTNFRPNSKSIISASDTSEIFTVVDKQPEPVGGMDAFYDYVANTLKYPTKARKEGIEGRVFIQFIVGKQGEISEVTVLKGIGYGCDQAAADILRNSSNWLPGTHEGKNVRVRMVMPISFSLGKNNNKDSK